MTEPAQATAYRNLMSYIVSNAAAGEITAVENYAAMLPLMPDVDQKLRTLQQANEESRHLRMLQGLGREQGFTVLRDSVEPEWRAIRAAFREAAAREDLVACLLIQEVMVETMAIVLYRMLTRQDVTDPSTVKIAEAILRDELEHLDTGVDQLRTLVAAEPAAALAALEWCHDRVMPELFSLATTECERLCDDLGVDCGSLDLATIEADLYDIRSDAADRYIETLDRIGFDANRIHGIVASMSAFQAEPGDGRVSCC